jgi:hypothetical protein
MAAQIAVRTELTGEPHVERRAHALQHLHLLSAGAGMASFGASTLMRQVEQAPPGRRIPRHEEHSDPARLKTDTAAHDLDHAAL